jgi:hypothetical protein
MLWHDHWWVILKQLLPHIMHTQKTALLHAMSNCRTTANTNPAVNPSCQNSHAPPDVNKCTAPDLNMCLS